MVAIEGTACRFPRAMFPGLRATSPPVVPAQAQAAPLFQGARNLRRCRRRKQRDRLVDGLGQRLKRACDGALMIGCGDGTFLIKSRRLGGVGAVLGLQRIPDRIVEQGLHRLLHDRGGGVAGFARNGSACVTATQRRSNQATGAERSETGQHIAEHVAAQHIPHRSCHCIGRLEGLPGQSQCFLTGLQQIGRGNRTASDHCAGRRALSGNASENRFNLCCPPSRSGTLIWPVRATALPVSSKAFCTTLPRRWRVRSTPAGPLA